MTLNFAYSLTNLWNIHVWKMNGVVAVRLVYVIKPAPGLVVAFGR